MSKGKEFKLDFVQSRSHTEMVTKNRLQNDTVGGDSAHLDTDTVGNTGSDDH